MSSLKWNIRFFIRKDPRSDNEGTLQCTATWNGNRFRVQIGHRVSMPNWLADMQRCKARSFHGPSKTPASVINKDIDSTEEILESLFNKYQLENKIPTVEEIKADYEAIVNPQNDTEVSSIFKYYDEFINDGIRTGRWREGTLKKIRIVRMHLYDISPILTFDDLSDKGMSMLIHHLSNLNDKDDKMGLRNSTINKEIAVVKTFVRWAQEKGYCQESRFVNQKTRLKNAQKTVVYLTWEELMKVYNFDFGTMNHLSSVRDIFCFCCFTSLRYSDVKNLKRSNIKGDVMTITTVKTSSALTIDLNKYAKAILAKYEAFRFPSDAALPVISNQKMNDYLKELGRVCGLDTPITQTYYKGTQRIDETHPKWEYLTTHAGRRTFVVNALSLGIPPDVVMKWTGHSDYKAMKPYIDISDSTRRQAMSLFDNR